MLLSNSSRAEKRESGPGWLADYQLADPLTGSAHLPAHTCFASEPPPAAVNRAGGGAPRLRLPPCGHAAAWRPTLLRAQLLHQVPEVRGAAC